MVVDWEPCTYARTALYQNYLLPIFSGIAAISILPALTSYCNAYIHRKLKASRALFLAGFFFFVFAALTLSSVSFMSPLLCVDNDWFMQLRVIAGALYAFQAIMLLQILFYRLNYVFRRTGLAISSSTNRAWLTGSGFLGLYGCVAVFSLFVLGIRFTSILLIPLGLLTTLTTIWLVIIFIYKLVHLYRYQDGTASSKRKLEVIAVKVSVLCFISALTVLLQFVVAPISSYVDIIDVYTLYWICFIVDVYTGFLCIFLSYTYFHGLYLRVCGCCDSRFKTLLTSCVKPITHEVEMVVMSSPSRRDMSSADNEDAGGNDTQSVVDVSGAASEIADHASTDSNKS